MAAFVIKQLEKILARKELKWKTHEKLKNEVVKALDAVKNAAKTIDENAAFTILPKNRIQQDNLSISTNDNNPILIDSNLKSSSGSTDSGNAEGQQPSLVDGATPDSSTPIAPELYLMALLQSCKSGIPQVQTLALDSIQKLMIFGHITADETSTGLRRAELVISFVCDSFKGTGSDEQVSLQLLKVLLTAVQANNFAVHGQTLLLAIKTAYNIALASKSLVNQATARATLTQTVNFLFSKMEAEAIEKNFKPINLEQNVKTQDPTLSESENSKTEMPEGEISEKSQTEPTEENQDGNKTPVPELAEASEETTVEKSENPETNETSENATDSGNKESNPESRQVAEQIYNDVLNKVLDKVDPPPKFPDKNGFQSDMQKDCFIVLRSLLVGLVRYFRSQNKLKIPIEFF